MLDLDLNRLRREGRARIDADIPPASEFWGDLEVEPASRLAVRLEAQQAGPDVVVRGRVAGEFALDCRRCLEPVTVGIEEELGRLYRVGEDQAAEESEDVLALPPGTELDLRDPVRETVLLAVPRYAYCREECRGLCPKCGTNLNEATCECTVDEVDERWAPLRRLKSEG
ncbi:MAG: YceD family protein [Gemmatimonadota bacterium]